MCRNKIDMNSEIRIARMAMEIKQMKYNNCVSRFISDTQWHNMQGKMWK